MRNPYYEGPVSDHFDGIRFLNPAGEPETDRSFGEFLRWRRSAPDNRWPSSVDVTPVTPEARVDGLRVTMVGHATLLVQIAGLNILTDPVWRSEEHTSELQSLMRISYAVFCLKKQNENQLRTAYYLNKYTPRHITNHS